MQASAFTGCEITTKFWFVSDEFTEAFTVVCSIHFAAMDVDAGVAVVDNNTFAMLIEFKEHHEGTDVEIMQVPFVVLL